MNENETKEAIAHLSDSQTLIQKQLDEILKEKTAKAEDSGIAAAVNKVTDFEFQGIPIGAAVVGGAVAVFATEVIDGFMHNQSAQVRGMVKLAGAAGVMMIGKKFIGTKAAGAVALLMAFDAIKNDLLPQPFAMVTSGANKLTGVVTTNGLGWTGGAPPKLNQNGVNQAQAILTSSQKMAMR